MSGEHAWQRKYKRKKQNSEMFARCVLLRCASLTCRVGGM
jgi:hypothetical protein